MVSSEDRPARIAQAKAAGADAYLVKPLTAAILAETLRPLLARTHLLSLPNQPQPRALRPVPSRRRNCACWLSTTRSPSVGRSTKVLDADPELLVLRCGRGRPDCVGLSDAVGAGCGAAGHRDAEPERIRNLAGVAKDYPHLPVIMFSSLTERGAAATLDALMLGATIMSPSRRR